MIGGGRDSECTEQTAGDSHDVAFAPAATCGVLPAQGRLSGTRRSQPGTRDV